MILCTFFHFTSDLPSLSVLFTLTESFAKFRFIIFYTEGRRGHECSSLELQLKRFVYTLTACSRAQPWAWWRKLSYTHEETERKTPNKAHHWLTLTPPHCRHSFPAFRRAWVGSRVSSDDFNSGEWIWWNLQPSVMQHIPDLRIRTRYIW